MASRWAALRPQETKRITTVTDIEETSPYYFVARDPNGKILSEGELSMFKIHLPDEYLYKPFRSYTINRGTMLAEIQY